MPRPLASLVAAPAALALAASLATAPAPAVAAAKHHDWGSTRAPDRALRAGHHCYPYRYTVDPPSDDWAVEIFLVDPAGEGLAHHALDVDADPATGRRTWCIWGSATRPGRFKIRMRVTWQTTPSDVHRGWVKPSHFRLRKR